MSLAICLNCKGIEVIMELSDSSDNKNDGYHLPRAYHGPSIWARCFTFR